MHVTQVVGKHINSTKINCTVTHSKCLVYFGWNIHSSHKSVTLSSFHNIQRGKCDVLQDSACFDESVSLLIVCNHSIPIR